MISVVVLGGFDDIRSWHIRFLQESARFGRSHVFLWPDSLIRSVTLPLTEEGGQLKSVCEKAPLSFRATPTGRGSRGIWLLLYKQAPFFDGAPVGPVNSHTLSKNTESDWCSGVNHGL